MYWKREILPCKLVKVHPQKKALLKEVENLIKLSRLPISVHHQREHCPLFTTGRHALVFTQKRLTHPALMHIYGNVLDKMYIGSLNEELHQHQPREEGHLWSCVTPVSHFFFYMFNVCTTVTWRAAVTNCLLLGSWPAPCKVLWTNKKKEIQS